MSTPFTIRPGERILVITLSNIGDVVMTTPVLEALAAAYPETAIDVLADPRSSVLLRHAPYLGQVFERNKGAPWAEQWSLIRSLRQRRYALIVDLRTRVIPWLLRARRRLFKPARHGTGQHAVEEHFATLAPVLDGPAPACRIYLDADAVSTAVAMLEPLPEGPLLALAPGANWPGKRWPAAHYRALLDELAPQFAAAVIVGGRGDLAAPFDHAGVTLPLLDATDRTDLMTAAALLARAQAFVGNDSGLGHIAAALGAPTVTPFGPGDPVRYAPRGYSTRVVPAPENDLTRLAPATVAAAVRELLGAI